MISKKDEMSARAARMAQRPTRATAAADEEAAAPPSATVPGRPRTTTPQVRTKPVRITTDLDPQTYRALAAYSGEVADTLGRAKVAHAEVIRALIAELQANADVRDRVAGHIATRLSK